MHIVVHFSVSATHCDFRPFQKNKFYEKRMN